MTPDPKQQLRDNIIEAAIAWRTDPHAGVAVADIALAVDAYLQHGLKHSDFCYCDKHPAAIHMPHECSEGTLVLTDRCKRCGQPSISGDHAVCEWREGRLGREPGTTARMKASDADQ